MRIHDWRVGLLMKPYVNFLLPLLLLSACTPNVRSGPGASVLVLPADKTIYQAVWEYENPNQLNSVAQSVDHEGHARFTFVVGKNGKVAEITKEQVVPVNADISSLESLLKGSRFVPVYKRHKAIESYQSYTFYYGEMAYLEYWRETCEHEGNRNEPSAQSGIDATYPRFCTRVPYPFFVVYRFLLWPTQAACRRLTHLKCSTGRISVSFKLNPDGHPREVTVIKSDAEDLMDLAAKSSVENWYFVPKAGGKLHANFKYIITLLYEL